MRKHEVVVPCTPGIACSPNYRKHWSAKSRATKNLRSLAWAAGSNARPSKPYQGRVLLEAVICWEKGRKTMDRSNAAAALKGLVDGFTDALWWDDDKEVDILVVNQVSWSKQTKEQRAQFPQGCTKVEVKA